MPKRSQTHYIENFYWRKVEKVSIWMQFVNIHIFQ
jgi:hypothetical protein